MSNKTLIYIAGPTSVGKTELSINLAKKFNTEIISCDSRQFYKEMQIGTAVPTTAELSEVPHHFIQHKSVEDIYTVGDFEKEAIEKLEELFKTQDTLIMAGGSGMYADAIMFGMDEFPEVPAEARKQINLFYQNPWIKSITTTFVGKRSQVLQQSRYKQSHPSVACIRSLYCLRPALFLIFRKIETRTEFCFKNDRTPQS